MKLADKELVLPPKRTREKDLDVLCSIVNKARGCPKSDDLGYWWAEDHGVAGWVLCERRQPSSVVVLKAGRVREIWYFLTGVRVALEGR